MWNKPRRENAKMSQNSHDVIKLLLFLFTIFLYLFTICYNEAFFRIFSFPYERVALPINFYLINILRILFWNFSFFLFGSLGMVSIVILLDIIMQVIKAILGKSNWPKLSWQSISSSYESNKLLILLIAIIITYTNMLLAYEYRVNILEYIDVAEYILAENNELGSYVFISFYIYICLAFCFRGDYYLEAAKNILTIRARPIDSPKFFPNGHGSRIFIYLFLLLFSICFIFFNDSLIVKMGTDDAICLVKGEPSRFEGDHDRYELRLMMNDSSANLSNTSLIFFMQQDGFYYFVKKQGPGFGEDNCTSVYAVPSSRVKLASLTLIKSKEDHKSLTSGLI